MARRDDFVDERGPVVWPFLLEDRDKHEVELVQEGLLGAQTLFAIGTLDDELDDEVSDA